MGLSHKDFDALQGALFDLYEYRDLMAFQRALPDILLRLITADACHLIVFELNLESGGVKITNVVDPSEQITPGLLQLAESKLFDHPFPKYYQQTGDPTALMMSDICSLAQFQRTEAYQSFYRPMGFKRQIAAPANFGPGKVGAFTMGRSGREFTERDRLVINLLRPHIEQAHRNAVRATAHRLAPAKPLGAYELTPRETEIAHWVASGKTNPEIAIILGSKVRTVEKHMEKILEKLGVENRAAAAVMIVSSNGMER